MADTVDRNRSGFATPAEWRSGCTARHNVLLEGSAVSREAVLQMLEPRLGKPVVWRRPQAPLDLPAGECGALFVEDVGGLGRDEQTRLFAWLDDPNHRRQVVATTTSPLFPLVAQGLFDEALYYRLNVMLLHLDSMNTARLDAQDADQKIAAPSSNRQPTMHSTPPS